MSRISIWGRVMAALGVLGTVGAGIVLWVIASGPSAVANAGPTLASSVAIGRWVIGLVRYVAAWL